MERIESYPGTLCVCVNEEEPGSFSGEFYHRYSAEPVKFTNLLDMILIAEKIFDGEGAPMAFLAERSFKKKTVRKPSRRLGALNDTKEMIKHEGMKATFVVNVIFRQHASWQGKVSWVEGKKTSYFRSALELIKLMDSTMEESEPKELENLHQSQDMPCEK